MHRIRRATKSHRKVLLVVIILLMVGIVGTFAVWDSSSIQSSGNTSYVQLASQYEEYIASIEPESMDGMEYSLALNLAQQYSDYSSYAMYAYYESGDSVYGEKYINAIKSSADYYAYAAGHFTTALEEADYTASLENYNNYTSAGNLYQQYIAINGEDEDVTALYQSALQSASLWLDHALSVSGADLASADYETAKDIYNRYTEQYQLKYSLMSQDETADQTEYIAAMENAFAWNGRILDTYDPDANANAEEGIEGDSALTQAYMLYSLYGERFSLADRIDNAAGTTAYAAEYLANMQQAYAQLEIIAELGGYDKETADVTVAEEATDLYDTMASLCEKIAAVGGDNSYSVLAQQNQESALAWKTITLDKGTEYSESELSSLYSDLADRYMTLGQIEKAGEQLKKAAEAYPSFADPLLAYAEYLNEYQGADAAIAALNEGLKNMEEGSDDQISVQQAIENYQGN